mmetsp:Transcript_105513/g.235500  ORF Transcript_105513/g.235500 Transcript_105513/m.235500 type:complete len:237 (+) Transcript_105513:450-1160(+)
MHHVLRKLVLKHVVNHACELRMQTLIARDKLIGEGQARHEAPLLQPVDGAEGAAEEDALHCGECDDALGEAVIIVHPLHGPFRLLADRWHGVDGIEDGILLNRIPNILLDQERIGLRMDVLHRHLESIKGASLRHLDFCGKARSQILVDDAIRSGEEGQDVLDEVPLGIGQLIPILRILGKVDLLCRPERSLVLLVHLPDLMVLNGEHHPPPRVLLQERVVLLKLLVFGRNTAQRS